MITAGARWGMRGVLRSPSFGAMGTRFVRFEDAPLADLM